MNNEDFLKGIVQKIPQEQSVCFYIKIPKDYFNKFYELKKLRNIRTNGLLFCRLLDAEIKREKRASSFQRNTPEVKKPLVQSIAEEHAVSFYLSVPKYYFKKFRELKKLRGIRTNGLFFCHLLDAEIKREIRREKDREREREKREKKEIKNGR